MCVIYGGHQHFAHIPQVSVLLPAAPSLCESCSWTRKTWQLCQLSPPRLNHPQNEHVTLNVHPAGKHGNNQRIFTIAITHSHTTGVTSIVSLY